MRCNDRTSSSSACCREIKPDLFPMGRAARKEKRDGGDEKGGANQGRPPGV